MRGEKVPNPCHCDIVLIALIREYWPGKVKGFTPGFLVVEMALSPVSFCGFLSNRHMSIFMGNCGNCL